MGRAENSWFNVSAPWKISPPSRPNWRSRSSGDRICRPITLEAKPGAYLSTVAIMRSATSSRWSSHDWPSGNCGATCWQNRLATCSPGGARVSSSVEGSSTSTTRSRVLPGASHVVQAWAEDDAGGEMIAGAGQRAEGGQGVQRHVHPECAGAVAPLLDTVEKLARQRVRRHQPRIQQFRIDAGDDVFGADGLAIVADDCGGAVALDE